MLAVVLGLGCAGTVVVSLYLTVGRGPDASLLPPLNIREVNGTRTVVIDQAALGQFARRHRLPAIPELTQLSVEAAQDIYRALQSVADRPDAAETFGHLGRVLHSHQHPAEAIACYSRAATLAPAAYEWAYYQGRAHAELYQTVPAIEAYVRAAELNPTYAPTFLALGNLYRQKGDWNRAQKAYQRLVALRPHSSHGYLGLAQITFDREQYGAAVHLLTTALSRDAEDFRVHYLLGQAYQQLGQHKQADYHLGMVKRLDRRRQLTKHVVFDDPLYHKMLASNTTDAALTERMRAAMGTNQPHVAIRLGEELCRRHPNDARQMHSLALAYKEAGRYAEALDRVEKAIKLDRGLLVAHCAKAQLLLILHRHTEALKLLDWIVVQYPDAFTGHYYRGVAQMLAGQHDSAILSFREAIRLQDDSARAHVALAEALDATGRRAEAMDEYRRALKLDPSNARAAQQLRRGEP